MLLPVAQWHPWSREALQWQSGATEVATTCARVGAFPFTDPAGRDAAIYSAGLAPGTYTIHITGIGATSGIALAEVYDATDSDSLQTSMQRLVNASARTHVGIGEDILIAGFVISGSTPRAILVRGVGPALQQFGIGNVLGDPALRIFDSRSQPVAENDDWGGGTDLATAFAAVGAVAPPANSKDAAIAAVLPPGSYTAHLSGANGSAGVALVEVYELP